MTTDAERRVRDLLDVAAPEPRLVLRGDEIRGRADETPGAVVALRRRPRTSVLAAVLAVAAVVAVAFGAVLLGRHHAGGPATPAVHHGSATGGPAVCPNDGLVLEPAQLAADSTSTLTIRDRGRSACTLEPLPVITTVQAQRTISTLRPSRYRPSDPVVVGPGRPVRIVVRLHAVSACGGASASPTSLGFRMRGFTYSAKLTRAGCVGYAIASATVEVG